MSPEFAPGHRSGVIQVVGDPLLWVAVAATALSGFFSLNHCALRSVARRHLEAAFVGRSRRYLEPLQQRQAELQMVCALLRTLANLALLVALLEVFAAPGGGAGGILRALVLTAGIVTVVGVAIPHAWAHYAAPKILSTTAPLLLALRWALWPVVIVMRAFDVPVRRLSGAGAPSGAAAPEGSEEGPSRLQSALKAEILQAASESGIEGAGDFQQVRMIASVIEFGDRRAGQIMTPRTDIVALPLDAPADAIRRTVIEAGHTRIPVYDGDVDNVVGILHAKDLLKVDSPGPIDLRAMMRKPLFIPETKPLDELLAEFKARKSHMAIVLDEYGGTAGLVTLEDLIEEIVGDISDEHDRAQSPLLKRIDGQTVEVDGRMYIDDLNDALGLNLPEDADYDTVAGFVFSELGFIPPVGESLRARGAVFTVLAADARKITRIRVQVPARGPDGE